MAKGSFATSAALIADLVSFVTDQISDTGLTLPANVALSDRVETALDDFNAATGYYPFIVPEDADEETFTVAIEHTGAAFFRRGAISTEDIVLTVDDIELTAGETNDYVLQRETRDPLAPYTWVKTGKSSGWLEVTGVLGWGMTVPNGAYQCIADMAMMAAVPYMIYKQTGNVAEFAIGSGDLRVKFESGKGALSEGVEAAIKARISRYSMKSL